MFRVRFRIRKLNYWLYWSRKFMPDENLALVFQEILTAIERLRSNRQVVPDAEAFRAQIREAFKSADREGRQRGYSPEDIRLATFAVVAFLDESILNSRNPVF